MVRYAMISSAMVWKVWYAMRCLCYAMVYVVKDKHSATVNAPLLNHCTGIFKQVYQDKGPSS